MKPWTTQNELLKQAVPSPEEITQKIENIPEKRTRAFLSLLYLTAGRISEVTALKKCNIRQMNHNGKNILLVENMPNRKHRRKHYKDIPIIIEKHERMCKFIIDYLNTITSSTDRLFPITTRRIQQLLTKHTDISAHYIRHVRLTHMSKYTSFQSIDMMKYAGWTNTDQADRYIESRWYDLVEKM